MKGQRLLFWRNRLRERLWLRPLLSGLLSVGVALLARGSDILLDVHWLPVPSAESLEKLLTVLSASMLGIAVFAVGSMVAAYAAASSSATPRTFRLVIADDSSQNALSTFIGAFIFSLVALTALLNDFYDQAGRLLLFLITVVVFAAVILSFLRWVDRIARLGRLGNTVDKVEAATAAALSQRRAWPTLGARPLLDGPAEGEPLSAPQVGYVQRVDLATLQACAQANDLEVDLLALPGTFATPDRPLLRLRRGPQAPDTPPAEALLKAFVIGDDRTFEADPRFGLVVLAEIAGRALSPAVNDPGTAIDIIGTLVRLFVLWAGPAAAPAATDAPLYDRVRAPALRDAALFEDAYTAIARDGAGSLEVMIRLQKALRSLAALDDGRLAGPATAIARLAARHAALALRLPEERERLRRYCLDPQALRSEPAPAEAGARG